MPKYKNDLRNKKKPKCNPVNKKNLLEVKFYVKHATGRVENKRTVSICGIHYLYLPRLS